MLSEVVETPELVASMPPADNTPPDVAPPAPITYESKEAGE